MENYHTHKCKRCNASWKHHNKCSQLAYTDRQAYKKAHKCPVCNKYTVRKYFKDEQNANQSSVHILPATGCNLHQ